MAEHPWNLQDRIYRGAEQDWLRRRVFTPPKAPAGVPLSRQSPKKLVSPGSEMGQMKMDEAFHEVHHDEPAIVGQTRRKKGAAAAERQRTAIALEKSRDAGVKIPRRRRR